jgi:N-acetylglucosamine-6-phosphate deacetylase
MPPAAPVDRAGSDPGQLLGVDDRKGSIAPERDADLVILDSDLRPTGVLVRGVWARQLDTAPRGGRR